MTDIIYTDADGWSFQKRTVNDVAHLCICAPDGVIASHWWAIDEPAENYAHTVSYLPDWLKAWRGTTAGSLSESALAMRELGRLLIKAPPWSWVVQLVERVNNALS